MIRRRPARTGLAAILVAAAAVLVAGCVGLPTDGAVSSQEIDNSVPPGSLVALPEGPRADASPTEIIQGFVRAGRAPQDGYRIARQFLTDDFATQWRPNAQARVSSTPITPQPVDVDSYRVDVQVLARVTESGNFSALASPETEPLGYTLVQGADEQWRISSAPDGTVLSQNAFNDTFRDYPLYFFDPSGDYLVPDLRWFPDPSSVKDRIVAQLLAGQSAWLGGGVLVTAFPTGTEQVDPVEIEGGQATVDLSSQVREQSIGERQRMLQQLTASLSSLADVQSVRITVNGFPVEVPEGGTQPERVLTVSSSPLGMAEGAFGYLSGSGVNSIPGISTTVEGLTPVAVSLGRGGALAAVLNASGTSFVSAELSDPVPVDLRPGLIAPTLDPEGYLWSTDTSGALFAYDLQGGARPIALPVAAGSRVVAIEISRDGTRMLIALQGPDGPQLIVAGIVRETSLVPTGLASDVLVLPVGEAGLVDVAWVDATTVAALSQIDGTTSVELFQLGGRRSSLGAIAGGVAIAGGNGEDGIRVIDTTGALFRPAGSSAVWQDTSLVASLLATQQ